MVDYNNISEQEWFNEYIKDVPIRKHFYKFMCFFLGVRKKGLKYKEMYLILERLNMKVLGFEESKKHAMIEILTIYKYNNNKLPDGIKLEEDGGV